MSALTRPPDLRLRVPGDKSLSHRALMMAALADGPSRITGLLVSEDVASTQRALEALGARFVDAGGNERLCLGNLGAEPCDGAAVTLDCGNSGTTMRLLLGLVAGLNRAAHLIGDASLSKRPMARVIAPLEAMGARINAASATAPLTLTRHGGLIGRPYTLPIASGQIKGALLLAALGARGTTTLEGALGGRDHTERLLRHYGAPLVWDAKHVALHGPARLCARDLPICGDPSAAAFWLALAALSAGGRAQLENVSHNETRLGFVRLLRRMGAEVRLVPARTFGEHEESFGDITLVGCGLVGVEIAAQDVPALIDELPLVAVLATQAQGTTVVTGAGELRHKESDRIAAMCRGLAQMGADIRETRDGFVVRGPTQLVGTRVHSQGDHRIAMALSIAALVARGITYIEDCACVAISYPQFFTHLPGEGHEVF